MDKGEDYISVMRENLEALKKTTDQPGKDIQPEHAEDEKTVSKGYFEDSAVKDRTCLITLANGNRYILT